MRNRTLDMVKAICAYAVVLLHVHFPGTGRSKIPPFRNGSEEAPVSEHMPAYKSGILLPGQKEDNNRAVPGETTDAISPESCYYIEETGEYVPPKPGLPAIPSGLLRRCGSGSAPTDSRPEMPQASASEHAGFFFRFL